MVCVKFAAVVLCVLSVFAVPVLGLGDGDVKGALLGVFLSLEDGDVSIDNLVLGEGYEREGLDVGDYDVRVLSEDEEVLNSRFVVFSRPTFLPLPNTFDENGEQVSVHGGVGRLEVIEYLIVDSDAFYVSVVRVSDGKELDRVEVADYVDVSELVEGVVEDGEGEIDSSSGEEESGKNWFVILMAGLLFVACVGMFVYSAFFKNRDGSE